MNTGPEGTGEEARDAAKNIVDRLVSEGHVAYFAGGCVRDILLSRRDPARFLRPCEYDVATDATPDRIREIFPRAQEVGAKFGVMLVTTFGPTIEVATFREEGPYSDARHPDHVSFTNSAEVDAHRRDFTINGMFLDPSDDSAPPVDHVKGQQDLADGVIRAIGDPCARFSEDHLRLLRAVRFAARLAFRIEEQTAASIRNNASSLAGVSRERIGVELRLMLGHETRAEAACLLHELGLAGDILGSDDGKQGAGSRLANLPANAVFTSALVAWLLDRDDCGDAVVDRLAGSLILTNHEQRRIRGILAMLPVLRDQWDAFDVAQRRRLAARPEFSEGLSVLSSEDTRRQEAVLGDCAQFTAAGGGSEDLDFTLPRRLLNGDHLIMIGLEPGPDFRSLLETVYDAQLEGEVTTPEMAISMARDLIDRFKKPGSDTNAD